MKIKIARLFFLLLLCIAVVFISACGTECTEHTDADNDGKCDTCTAAVEKTPCVSCVDCDGDGVCDVCSSAVQVALPQEILLIDKIGTDLVAKFRIVIPSGASSSIIKAADFLVRDLKKLGLEVEKVSETEAEAQECEVLIGDVTTRGEKYSLYRYDFGEKGYTVRIIDKKIIIQAGSDAKFEDAINSFKSNFLKIKSSTKKLDRVSVLSNVSDTVIQDDYRVKSLTLAGADMKGYKIAADRADKSAFAAAEEVQRLFYTQTGYYFEIVPRQSAPESRVIFISKAERTGGFGFSLEVTEGKIEIVGEYDLAFLACKTGETEIGKEAVNFFTKKIAFASDGTAQFSVSDSYEKNIRDISYEDFGAKGDGNENDIEAIRACHVYANEHMHNVVANPGKTYYIPPLKEPIPIKTNVDWKNAHIVIDDRNIAVTDEERKVELFEVLSAYQWFSLTSETSEVIAEINKNGGLSKDTDKLDLGLGYKALIKVVNSNHKMYIRYGANQNSGSNQSDVILIDEKGNFDKDTPLLYDYDVVTAVYVYRADEAPMTISGGYFQHRANQANSSYQYYSRNFDIRRSNLTVKNITYEITDERTGRYEGEPYNSFLRAENCNNLRFTDCKLTAHRAYYSIGADGKTEVGMGSKVLSVANTNDVVYERCVQTNMFTDESKTELTGGLWDIMGSNYSKNVSFIDCTLSRFDAHSGIYNATIKNCELNSIRVVGDGTLTIEGCEFWAPNVANNFISLREDYGSFWKGTIIVKDVYMHTKGTANVLFITGHWYNHNFGYTIALPEEIIIDNFTIDDNSKKVMLFSSAFATELQSSLAETVNGVPNINPATPPTKVVIRNNSAGVEFVLPSNAQGSFFSGVEYEIED